MIKALTLTALLVVGFGSNAAFARQAFHGAGMNEARGSIALTSDKMARDAGFNTLVERQSLGGPVGGPGQGG